MTTIIGFIVLAVVASAFVTWRVMHRRAETLHLRRRCGLGARKAA